MSSTLAPFHNIQYPTFLLLLNDRSQINCCEITTFDNDDNGNSDGKHNHHHEKSYNMCLNCYCLI